MIEKEMSVKRDGNSNSRIIIGDINSNLSELINGRKAIIITDEKVYPLYRKLINEYNHIVIGCGEKSKTVDTICQIYSQLLMFEADRSSVIVGFGGGIVTDIAGFAAATYMRGIDFGFVATTLLSQVDASIGGKNGINFEGYKNMIGTYTQPSFVICDPSTLKTLPVREFQAGIAEIIKMAIIRDTELFSYFEKYTFTEIHSSIDIQRELISRAIGIKASIVEEDEMERGERRKLNLGHTVGHAIERSSEMYIHGEAVSIGISMIAKISNKLGRLSNEECEKVDKVLTNMGLPTNTELPKELIFNALKLDKKKEDSSINLVIICSIGNCEVSKLSFAELANLLNVNLI